MSLSLIIDDTSLILLLLIILTLSLSLYISPSYSPLIHPLILSRQSDVSKVRLKSQSPIYRNSNSPAGFQLANKPRRKVLDSDSILSIASTGGQEIDEQRNVLGRLVNGNKALKLDTQRLVNGLNILKGDNDLITGIHTGSSQSYGSLISILSSGGNRNQRGIGYNALVIPDNVGDLPNHIPKGLNGSLINALFLGSLKDENLLNGILSLSILDPSSVLIVDEAEQVDELKSFISNSTSIYSKNQFQVLSFDDILQVGKQFDQSTPFQESDQDQDEEEKRLRSIHSHYWMGSKAGYVAIYQENLTSGLTSQLALFPADKIPTVKDSILILSDVQDDLLISSRHPSGLILDLLSIYTGSTLVRSTIDEQNVLKSLESNPTLIYSTPKASSILTSTLMNKSNRSSSALSNLAFRSKLVSLRHGNNSKNTVWDKLFFDFLRKKTKSDSLRFISVQGSGNQISQSLLDDLRSFVGCSVINSYNPSQVLFSNKSSKPALVVSPITASHTLDLQAFSTSNEETPSHSGPPSVSLELILSDDSTTMKSQGLKINQKDQDKNGEKGDFLGEIFVRGKTVTNLEEAGEEEWFGTSDLGQMRSNGTLIVLESSDSNKNDLLYSPNLNKKSHQKTSRKTGSHLLTSTSLFLGLISMVQAASSTNTQQLIKRENYSPNNTLANVCRMGMLSSPRATWEQGTAQSALLEFEHGQWSVFNGEKNGPPFRPNHIDTSQIGSHPPWSVISLAYRSSITQDGLGRLGVYVTGDEPGGNMSTGSSLDSASMGEGILLSAFVSGQLNDGVVGTGMYARSAQRQLDYVLNDVVRLPNGAISQRINTQEVWSDSLYMLPPFLAAYGLYTSNQTLLQLAYDQIKLYRDLLRIQEGPGENMFMHIYNSTNITNSDTGAWATGNGWSTAGMVRVLASIAQSPFSDQMVQQKTDLANWTNEILDAAYPFLDQGSGLFHNYINATTEFNDASGSAIIAYATFRLASMSPDYAQHIEQAEQIYQTVQNKVSPIGVYEGVDSVYALGFTTPGPTSAESLAFNLLLMSARRDYHSGNVTGLNGPGTGNENSANTLNLNRYGALLIGGLALGFSLL